MSIDSVNGGEFSYYLYCQDKVVAEHHVNYWTFWTRYALAHCFCWAQQKDFCGRGLRRRTKMDTKELHWIALNLSCTQLVPRIEVRGHNRLWLPYLPVFGVRNSEKLVLFQRDRGSFCLSVLEC